MTKTAIIPVEIVPSKRRCMASPRQVKREFSQLLDDGANFKIAGTARKDADALLAGGLGPQHKISLFDTLFYLTDVRQIPELRFYVAYVVQTRKRQPAPTIFPRIFYKDLSLVWRSASHFAFVNGDFWVGKGDVRVDEQDGHETIESIEATTDLPLEIQTALEELLQLSRRARSGDGILSAVLRQAPEDRVEPYHDFKAARKKAAENRRNLINRGRSVARFKRAGDPASLTIVEGYEPDFDTGIIERATSHSKLYGGRLRRFRILSTNRKIQYYFIAGARHVWIIPPQAITTELSTYGVRTIDVVADDDLFIPGYEYHHYEETQNGLELYSQIPPGFAGAVCPVDDSKADASPWLDQIPLIQEFRQRVLGQKRIRRV